MKIKVKPRHGRPSWAMGKIDLVDLLVSPAKWDFEKDWEKEEEVALEGIKV